MDNQTLLKKERNELLEKFSKIAPEFMTAQTKVIEVAYKDGVLSRKVKRLIALAVALKAGSTNCILAQTEKALEEGATKDEILETLQVLIAGGGTTGMGESIRVIKYLDELGHL